MLYLNKEELKALRKLYRAGSDGCRVDQFSVSDDMYIRLRKLDLIDEPGALVVPKGAFPFNMVNHSDKVFITEHGKAVLEYHASAINYKRNNDIRAWITAAIAVASFALSIIPYLSVS